MSEFRQNPVTKNWVLIAPNRGKRPEDYRTYSVMSGMPEVDSKCVFCPGNESLNPEFAKVPAKGDWEIRIIPNKYSALEHTTAFKHQEFYTSMSGSGDQEVIITRRHNEPVALQSISTVELTLKTLTERFKFYSKDEKVKHVQVFHNHGRDAGASLIHPHYQLFALQIIPPHIHNEVRGCFHYYHLNKSCIYCDIMKSELRLKDRLVYESEHFVVISAYASRKPFETWIVPKKHSPRFEDLTSSEIRHLAYVLKVTLAQLYTKLSDPPLNFYVHTMPYERTKEGSLESGSYHWHLTVFPRISIWGGFEYATGVPINVMPPEDTAKFLRGHEW